MFLEKCLSGDDPTHESNWDMLPDSNHIITCPSATPNYAGGHGSWCGLVPIGDLIRMSVKKSGGSKTLTAINNSSYGSTKMMMNFMSPFV